MPLQLPEYVSAAGDSYIYNRSDTVFMTWCLYVNRHVRAHKPILVLSSGGRCVNLSWRMHIRIKLLTGYTATISNDTILTVAERVWDDREVSLRRRLRRCLHVTTLVSTVSLAMLTMACLLRLPSLGLSLLNYEVGMKQISFWWSRIQHSG